MPESKAVFLSYASQDAVAASHLCDALRSAGIEVWFDRTELRGGDVWDQKIRRQIKDCALFIPIISAHTQARTEGYFRLEWRLADQRTHLMGRTRAFLVPVCVDDTGDAEADVPESFAAVQWTRLLHGKTSPDFIERVATLLAPSATSPFSHVARLVSTHQGAASDLKFPSESTLDQAADARPRSRRFLWGCVPLAIALLAMGYYAFHRNMPELRSESTQLAPSTAPSSTPQIAIPEKSVGILPFADMSEKKDQEYFSDGLTEEMIDLLSQESDLRVPARTSSFYFKGKNEPIASIAQQLKVAHVLEGSVRKDGRRLRITAQLIRADNGYHLWSQTYDRQDADIFALQDEIAKAVVTALQGKLETGGVAAAGTRGTTNTEAYNEYLRGREIYRRGGKLEDNRHAVQAYRRATELDPHYAAAYAGLAMAENFVADLTGDMSGIERTRDEVEQAIALAPDDARGYAARASLRTNRFWDWSGAQSDIEKALLLDPRDSEVQRNYAELLDTLGRLPEAIASQTKATELDPVSTFAWDNLGYYAVERGDYAAAEAAFNRALELDPKSVFTLSDIGDLRLQQGRNQEALDTYRRMDQESELRPAGIAMAEHSLGHVKESQQALEELISKHALESAYQVAEVYAWRGEKDLAFEWLERAYSQRDGGLAGLKPDPLLKSLKSDPRYRALLAKMKLPG